METLPIFPNFRLITLNDRAWYDQAYVQFEPYADLSFSNLMIWLNQHSDLALSQLHGNIIIRCTALYMNNQLMFNILGEHSIDETIQTIFAWQKANGLKQELLGVPEFVFSRISDPGQYIAFEDRENFEYILDAHLLTTLEGSSMKRLRQYTNNYEYHAGDVATIEQLDLTQPDNVAYLRVIMNSWEKSFATNESASQEINVMNQTFQLAGRLGYESVCLKVGGKLAGFIIYQSQPYNHTIIANHLKNSYQFPHTSFYLTHRLAQILDARGVKYINYEQDLGIQGLRDFKMKLRPHHLLPKYNLTPAIQ